MSGRRIRSVCLLFAVWALLFAPGAVIGDGDLTGGGPDTDAVAAAIVAPTFGSGAFIGGTVCGDSSKEALRSCLGLSGPLPGAMAIAVAGLVFLIAMGMPVMPRSVAWRSSPSRAPPTC